ncbi:MAG: hypothetical protein HY606_04270 [Planctomycetes bacterium]|nr:hypothetical protein [Planctomycetota bacterium]
MKIHYWTLVIISLFLITGCFHKHQEISGGHSTAKENKVLTSDDVAIMASGLANDECERIYGKRPFSAGIYSAELINTTWYWGRLDPSGVNGFSAEVSLERDGTGPKVKIYFSTDTLQPTPIMYPENRIDMVPAENDNVLIDVVIKK